MDAQTIKKQVKELLIKFVGVINKYYVVFCIIKNVSVITVSLFSVVGQSLNWISNNSIISAKGYIAIVSLLLIIVSIEAAVVYYKRHDPKDEMIKKLEEKRRSIEIQLDMLRLDNEKQKRGTQLFDMILQETRDLCYNKGRVQLRQIKSIADKNNPPIRVYSRPFDQMSSILSSVKKVLIKALTTDKCIFTDQNCSVCLAYTLEEKTNENWHWAESIKEDGLPIMDLIKSKSTIAYLIRGKSDTGPFVFENDKETLRQKGWYVLDKNDVLDEEGRINGSIACFMIVLKKDDIIFCRAVLCISTFGIRFVNGKKDIEKKIEDTKRNIISTIVPEFEARIRYELGDYCMMNLEKLYGKSKRHKTKSSK